MNHLQETCLVCAHELRRTLRSPKAAILFLLYALVASLVGLVFMHTADILGENIRAFRLQDTVEQMGLYRKMVVHLFGEKSASQEWLFQMPPFLLFFYKFNLIFLPGLVVLIGFDQISGELQTRSLRYLAPRIHRSSILLGKLLSQFILLVCLVSLMSLGAILFTRSMPEASWSVTLLGMLRFGILTLLAMLAYLGLTALFSSMTKTPIHALIFSLCALVFFWLLGALSNFSSLAFLQWFTPATYEPELLSGQPLMVLTSVMAYMAFTTLFLGGALFRLHRKDL